MTTGDVVEVPDHAEQARDFLAKSREHLTAGHLHPASRKGWRAAEHMARAVAAAQGWEYATRDDFSVVLNEARRVTDDDRLPGLRGIANDLHGNYYRRKRHLDAEVIGRDIESMAELVEILAPLTTPSS